MVRCSFCGSTLLKGTGKMYVKKDGTVFFFCSNKCEKNLLKLGRSAGKTRWTQGFADKKKAQSQTQPKAAAKKPAKKKK